MDLKQWHDGAAFPLDTPTRRMCVVAVLAFVLGSALALAYVPDSIARHRHEDAHASSQNTFYELNNAALERSKAK
jgi:hypothetical protein